MTKRNADNENIQTAYVYGLIDLCAVQGVSDKKMTLQKLTGLIEKLPNDERLNEQYAIELSLLCMNKEQYVMGLFWIYKIYLDGQDAVGYDDEMSLYEYIRGKIEKIKERFPENEVIQEVYKNISERRS